MPSFPHAPTGQQGNKALLQAEGIACYASIAGHTHFVAVEVRTGCKAVCALLCIIPHTFHYLAQRFSLRMANTLR